MKHFDVLVFVQAAADLRYALDIIENNKEKHIHIFVIHIETVYSFLKTLSLPNVKISFQDYYGLKVKKPETYYQVKKQLKKFWEYNFKDNNYEDVYFFSRFYDFHTASIIVKLCKISKVYYYDHYDAVSVLNDTIVKKYSYLFFKLQYISFIVSLVSGAKFKSKYKKRYLEFSYEKYPIQKAIVPKKVIVNNRFKYHLKDTKYNKKVIFLLSPDELKMITDVAEKKLTVILNYFKSKNYTLYLKGHPRLGKPKQIKHFFDEVIPDYVPNEFLVYSEFELTIGIISSGLAYPSQFKENKVFSIINLLEFKNIENKLFYSKFLKEHSKGKVKFLENIEYIKS